MDAIYMVAIGGYLITVGFTGFVLFSRSKD